MNAYDFSDFPNVELISVELTGRRPARGALPAGAVLSGDDRRGHGYPAGDRLAGRGIRKAIDEGLVRREDIASLSRQ